MSTIDQEFDVETYVMMEKAAEQAGKKTVEEWLGFLLSERVGLTPFCQVG